MMRNPFSSQALRAFWFLLLAFSLRSEAFAQQAASQRLNPRDLSSFRSIAEDTLAIVNSGNLRRGKSRINMLALGARLPVIHSYKDNLEGGGLISYGPDLLDLYRRAAGLADKILRGTKPADIPVEQPTKFELAINLKTAKTLGLAIPATLLARADEVIE